MMNEEEKKAIGNLKIIAEYIGENYFFGKQGIENLKKDINVTLNYINQLQKEIKELKDDKEGLINGYKDTAYKLEELRVNYNKLQKELDKEKEKNKKLNLENQALFESINCNDDNMLAGRYQKLQKELDKKDKIIDLIIDDFQAEGYFKEMTYEQVKKYYDNRNELNQEINILPLNLDLTSE